MSTPTAPDPMATTATVVRADEVRRTATPNAVMTTLASPTQGGSRELSLWRVQMEPGQQGPAHVFDREQLWTVVDGAVRIVIDAGPGRSRPATAHDLGPGDTLVIPGGVVRQVTATTAVRLVVCGHADAQVTVPGEATGRGVPPWIA